MNSLFEKLAFLSTAKVLALGLGLGAAYYFLIFDDGSAIQTRITSTKQEIVKEQEKKKDVDATLLERKRVEKSVGELTSQYEQVSRRLPSTLTSIEVNRTVDQFAASSGINVKSRRPGKIIPKDIVEEVPIELTLEGTFSELTHFMYFVSSMERVTLVSDFTLDSTPDTPSSGKIKFTGSVLGLKLASAKEADAKSPEQKGMDASKGANPTGVPAPGNPNNPAGGGR